MGMQAQQARPPFVGLWTRIEGFESKELLQSIEDREIVRATAMRGTLHLVHREDYIRFRTTLQPMLSAGMQAILKDRLKDMDRSAVLGAARCAFEGRLTFTEMRGVLMREFPKGDERAMGYLARTHLPVVSVPDDAKWAFSGDSPFTLVESWLGKSISPVEDQQALVLRYLAAFGPAAVTDAQAWSGFANLKGTFAALRPKLKVFPGEGKRELFDLPDAPRPEEETPVPVRFVPAFDNAILAHADRRRVISDDYRPRVVTKNLQVLPTFLVDGFVAGTWSVQRKKKSASLTITPFAPLTKAPKKQLLEEGERLIRFLEEDAAEFSVRCDPI